MEGILFENNTQQMDDQNLSRSILAGNRMQALKSLVVLLMHEVEFLENLTPQSNSNNNKNGSLSLEDEVEHYEIELIRNALMQTRGHQLKAAKILGLKKTTLNAKLKRYGIDPRAFVISMQENHA